MILASLKPFSLYLVITFVKSSSYLSFMNFEALNILIGFCCLVFLKAFLNFLSENCSLPSKFIFLIFTLSPLYLQLL
jgi:hypothetical protein